MKKVFLTIVTVLLALTANASEDPNDVNPQGAGVAVTGQDCDTCRANVSNASIQSQRDYSALMPSDSSPEDTSKAAGTK